MPQSHLSLCWEQWDQQLLCISELADTSQRFTQNVNISAYQTCNTKRAGGKCMQSCRSSLISSRIHLYTNGTFHIHVRMVYKCKYTFLMVNFRRVQKQTHLEFLWIPRKLWRLWFNVLRYRQCTYIDWRGPVTFGNQEQILCYKTDNIQSSRSIIPFHER